MCCIQFLAKQILRGNPFFLLFGRDPIVSLNSPLKPMAGYLGTDDNNLSLEALTNLYQLVVFNLELARRKRDTKAAAANIKESDLVLLRDCWCTGDYRIVSFYGKTQVEVVDSTGKTKAVHIFDVKYIGPTGRVVFKLLDDQSFGRQSKLKINQHISI